MTDAEKVALVDALEEELWAGKVHDCDHAGCHSPIGDDGPCIRHELAKAYARQGEADKWRRRATGLARRTLEPTKYQTIGFFATPGPYTFEIVRTAADPLDNELCACGAAAVGAVTFRSISKDSTEETRNPYCAEHSPRGMTEIAIVR